MNSRSVLQPRPFHTFQDPKKLITFFPSLLSLLSYRLLRPSATLLLPVQLQLLLTFRFRLLQSSRRPRPSRAAKPRPEDPPSLPPLTTSVVLQLDPTLPLDLDDLPTPPRRARMQDRTRLEVGRRQEEQEEEELRRWLLRRGRIWGWEELRRDLSCVIFVRRGS